MTIDLETEQKEMESLVAAMRALNRDAYFDQDILKRIYQARMVMELESIDPLIWHDEGIGITVSDVLHDAIVELKRLMPSVGVKESILEQAHWIAAPMKDEQFSTVVKRAEEAITLLKAREDALRVNLKIAADTIKKLQDD